MSNKLIEKLLGRRLLWVLCGMLPLLVFALAMLWLFSQQQEKAIQRSLREAATHAAHVVDRTIREQIGLLNGMAASRSLDHGDFAAFRLDAQRIWDMHPEWRTVILTDEHQPVFNLRYPPEKPLTPLRDPDSWKMVWNTRKPYVGNLSHGYVAIRVPVIREDRIVYTLVAPTRPVFFQNTLQAAQKDQEWGFIIVGSDNAVISASREVPMKAGDRLPQSFMEKGIDEFSSTDMRQAEPVPVGSSGWQLFIFAAADTVEAPFLKKRLIVGLGGMIAGLLTTILVLVLSSALVAKQEALYLRREMEERNLMQQALAGSEKRYRSLFDSIRDAILVADTDRTVIDCNPAFVDLFGYSREEIVGQKTLALYENEETFIRLGQELETHIDHGEFITRVKFRQKSGTVFNGETKIYYLRDEDDNLLGFIGLIRDISQRLAAEAAIRESEQRFRSVVENAPDAIFVQTQGRFAYLNEAAVILFGAHHAADLVGEPVLDRFHPDYRDLVGERMRILNQERKPVPRLLEVGLRMDGSSVALEASAVPFEMDGRQGALVFVRDMTESHRVRERQVKLEQQLHQAQKMEAVGRLAGGIAHDFNNLLSVILGYGEIVLEELPPLHPHRELMEEVHQAGLRAKDLTRQLLAFSRKQILEMKTVDLNAVVLGFEKLIRRLIGEDIVLKLSLISGELFVKADTGQLEQVLMNLAVNARDAMPDGGLLAIETSVVDLDESYTDKRPDFQPGTYAMVGVSDTGSGMEGDVLPKIFEPFFTTKGQEKGTGLGLATSYGIIKQHGGSIWVYSEPGEGSTFKIYLPLSTEPVSKEAPATDQDRPVDRSTTVLVVEDDPSVRKLACSILKKAGYDVIHSENVNDAIVLAAEQRRKIHLVLTDVIMPGMKGPEVFEKIRQSHPEAKVLYMSGYTDNVIVHHGVLMEGIAFIQKPFTAKNLLHKVHHAIVD